MVDLIDFGVGYYHPPAWPGLEEIIRFPGGEAKRDSIPPSSVWIFDSGRHQFKPEIHGPDIGCGIAAFTIKDKDIDVKEATDRFFAYLKREGTLGRGNHFVDLCAPIEAACDLAEEPYKILLIHTHGRGQSEPKNITEAQERQDQAARYRLDLGRQLAGLVDSPAELIGNWVHNSIEEKEGKIIYRKGAVKVETGRLYFLPAHLGAKVLIYTIPEEPRFFHSSLPHGTGRSGPRGETKVTPAEASRIRGLVYVPESISNDSLRSEHPSCYNGYDNIFEKLRRYFNPIGETRILSYIGKV